MTAPGWYPDPDDSTARRYWDGQHWSEPLRAQSTAPDASAPPAPARARGVGIIGLVVTIAGAVAVIVSLTAATWVDLGQYAVGQRQFSAGDFRGSRFTDIPLAHAYCAWLGWILLAVSALFAIGSCIPSNSRDVIHIVAIFIGICTALLTILAVSDLGPRNNLAKLSHQLSIGPYLAVFGFLIIALGAAVNEVGA